MKKGATPDEFQFNDFTRVFREQNKRTLAEVDLLLQRQRFLAESLGPVRSAEIEANPDLYYNNDRFRIF